MGFLQGSLHLCCKLPDNSLNQQKRSGSNIYIDQSIDFDMELTRKINDKAVSDKIAADCTQLIDDQVSAKSGLSGMALKATYGVVKGIGGDYIPGAIQRLLPETLAALEPIWTEGVEKGDPVGYLSQNSDRTADIILSTTDARIARGNHGIIGASYQKLRKSVKRDVADAVPGLAQIIHKHIG